MNNFGHCGGGEFSPMSNEQPERPLDRLREISARQRHAAEQAEARAEEIAAVTRSLVSSVSSRTFLGGFLSRPYNEEAGRTDSAFVSQAALNNPQCLGVVGCGTEKYQDYRENDLLHERFRTFRDCEIAERTFLNAEVPSLIQQLEQYVVSEQPYR